VSRWCQPGSRASAHPDRPILLTPGIASSRLGRHDPDASCSVPDGRAVFPPSQSGRIDVLDVLRGIALCGMFVVHFNNYAAAGLETSGGEPSAAVRGLETFIGLFIDGRMYTMFAMLFGVGFALQLQRADARGERFAARYLRRLAALAVFGFIAVAAAAHRSARRSRPGLTQQSATRGTR
jgi:uncharacterized membrane protein